MVSSTLRFYAVLMLSALLLALYALRPSLAYVSPQAFPVYFYQHAIGIRDGRSCPSYPVCSVYARQAFQTHNPLIASWLVLDRLIHEADDVHTSHTITVDAIVRTDDSLSRNDFWLSTNTHPFKETYTHE